MCPPTGALKVVRHYELTDAGRAAAGAEETELLELAGLRLPERTPDAGRRALPAQGLAARVLPRARRRRDAAGTPLAQGAGDTGASRHAPARRARADRRSGRARGARAARRQRAVGGRPAAPAGRRSPGRGRPRRRRSLPLPLPGRRPASLGRRLPRRRRLRACANLADVPELLEEQRRALHAILCEAHAGDEVLLHGVTGSGKTEVYLQAAQATLDAGRSVLLLVPEIGLTGQTVARVKRRFAGEQVAVLHSGLSAGERLLAYGAVARGEVRIVVGARSAVFAPLAGLGLIVVDEEHDTSYKQESEPAYDARTVARWRAGTGGAVVVLGSATPSVESYARVARHADLRRRVDGSQPPALEIVDMRGHHGVFSQPLAEALAGIVDAGEKAILFLNRRGFASYLVCDHCGHAWECPNCDVTLTLFGGRTLRCRTCGHAEPAPSACPPAAARTSCVRLRHRAPRARGPPAAARRRPARASTRTWPAPMLAFACALPLLGTGAQGPRGHADDRQGTSLSGRDSRRRRQRGPHAALSGLSRRGAGPSPSSSRWGPQRPGRPAGPRHRADAGSGRATDRLRVGRQGRGVLRRGARAPAGTGLSAHRLPRRPRPVRDLEDKVGVAGRFTAERLTARLCGVAQVLGPGPLWRERGRHACRRGD